MKTFTAGLLAASFLFLAAGCENDDEGNDGRLHEGLRVTIWTSPDTLWFVQGETASAEVTVFVSHECCDPESGLVVHTSLAADHNGWLFPADSAQGDTTDDFGQIRYHYFTAVPGVDVIRATCELATASTEIVAAHPYGGNELDILLLLFPTLIDLSSPGADTVRVRATAMVRDSLDLPVPGLDLTFWAQRGSLDPAPLTDSSGRTETWWHQPETYPDTVWIEMTIEIGAWIGNFEATRLIVIRQ